MNIYISGKITADTKEEKLENISIFNKKAKELTSLGFSVFDPTTLEKEGKTWEEYIAEDVTYIVLNRPVMYMLKDWGQSRGARIEHELGKFLGLSFIYE